MFFSAVVIVVAGEPTSIVASVKPRGLFFFARGVGDAAGPVAVRKMFRLPVENIVGVIAFSNLRAIFNIENISLGK